jgi:uncharacterized protein YndB with AHSA1/START domain
MAEVKVTKDLENKTLIIECVVNGPKEKVWRAYAEKDLYEKWWGPEGWETTTKEFDFREGGRVHYCMKCVDKNQGEWYGQESWGLIEMEEIDAPNRFVGKDYFSDESGNKNSDMPGQTMAVELIEEDGKTRIVARSIVDSVEQLEQLLAMGMVEGFSSQLNRLEQLLTEI